nr:hypothetical protein [Tanacetum cinerariifolium]
MAIEGVQGRGKNKNPAYEKAFVMGVEEARQDPNIMTDTFTLNNRYATTLFDSGIDYCFVSITFIPLLDIEPSNLGFSYEIELASEQLVKINKEEHEMHLGLILELLKKEKLYAKFSKCGFCLQEVQFFRHVINGDGIHVDLSKIKNIKNWEASRTPSNKNKKFIWGEEQNRTKSVIYTNHKSLQHIFNHKELNMRQRHWIELFSDYDCEIRYHPDKYIERRSDGALYYLDRIWVPLMSDVRTLIMDETHKSRYSVHPGADKMYYDLRDMYWWPRIKKDVALHVNKCLTCSKIKGVVRFRKKDKLAP